MIQAVRMCSLFLAEFVFLFTVVMMVVVELERSAVLHYSSLYTQETKDLDSIFTRENMVYPKPERHHTDC